MESKYFCSLNNGQADFDSQWFKNKEDIERWAKGRGRCYDMYRQKYNKYTVQVFTQNADGILIPEYEYLEE